jgi:hypothetical protein
MDDLTLKPRLEHMRIRNFVGLALVGQLQNVPIGADEGGVWLETGARQPEQNGPCPNEDMTAMGRPVRNTRARDSLSRHRIETGNRESGSARLIRPDRQHVPTRYDPQRTVVQPGRPRSNRGTATLVHESQGDVVEQIEEWEGGNKFGSAVVWSPNRA